MWFSDVRLPGPVAPDDSSDIGAEVVRFVDDEDRARVRASPQKAAAAAADFLRTSTITTSRRLRSMVTSFTRSEPSRRPPAAASRRPSPADAKGVSE